MARNIVKVAAGSVVSNSFVTPRIVVIQTPLSMGFSMQESCGGLPFPPLWDLPDPGFELMSLVPDALAGRFLTPVPPRKPPSTIRGR